MPSNEPHRRPGPSSPTPRISVIIPNLNQEIYLEQAICSVLDQGYENLELLVMDGGSIDQSQAIIDTYAEDLDYWQSAWDSGPAEAVNTALTWATGQITLVLDADDTLLPHALHEAAAAFAAGAEWVVGRAVRVDEIDEVLGELPARAAGDLAGFLADETGPLRSSAVFYRTDLLKAMGGFDSAFKLAYAHEMHARLYAAERTPTPLSVQVATVRDHDHSLTATHGLLCGTEYLDAAERYARHLAPTPRFALWRSCDESRRIFAAAELQIQREAHTRGLWQQLLKRPWWLARADYRQKLLLKAVPAEAAQPAKVEKPTEHRRAA